MEKAIAALGNDVATNQRMHMGPHAHLLHFSVADHTLMNVVAFVSDPEDHAYDQKQAKVVNKDAVTKAFKDFGPTVRTITSLLPEQVNEWAIFDTGASLVPRYADGRACLVGDAAHAAAPHHGAGAGIGVEDALALCHVMELATTSIANGTRQEDALNAAFVAYEAVRRERTHWFVISSRNICDVYEWQHPEIGRDFDKIFKEIEWRSHKIWYFDFKKMQQQLESQYQQIVSLSKTG
jgi:salicylate hydroxylase